MLCKVNDVFYDNNVNNAVFTKRYMQQTAGVDLLQLFVNARDDFGCTSTLGPLGIVGLDPCFPTVIITILIAILAAGGVMMATRIMNPMAGLLIGGIVIVFFTLTGWFYWPLIFIFGIIAVFGAMGRKVSR